MNITQQKIEALLFYKNEPVSFSWLGKKLEIPETQIKQEVSAMTDFYHNRGIKMIYTEQSVSLMTHDVSQDLIQAISKTGEERDLSKQALETLSIILYKERITKSEIDYIRGVNSVFILRNLLIRGLITKKQNILDKRAPFYVPTHELFSFLGIESVSQLPDREAIHRKLELLETDYQNEQSGIKQEPIIVNGSDE